MTKKKAFFAYPGAPQNAVLTIRAAIDLFNKRSNEYLLEGWESNDISGIPLIDPIYSRISSGAFVAADVTYLNENVMFEVGYAIGSKKRCLLFVNSTLEGERNLANNVGIFDTLGYELFDNSESLAELLLKRTDFAPLEIDLTLNHEAPVFIVEPSKRDDAFLRLVSRTKKARWRYRSFNPDEDVRMSALDAIEHVCQSAGVIAPLQGQQIIKSREHNLRAIFVGGLATALDVPVLLIHATDYTPPLDVRDLTKKYRHPDDILEAVNEISLEITERSQRSQNKKVSVSSPLSQLSIGDPTAENEMTTLADYYLSTDEYERALRGEVNLVVGRKGSGKTALFVQLRDKKRSYKPNIIVDLKPEGYQLVKLKERVFDFLTLGAQEHLITALWEYILLLEISYKVLEKDKLVHIHDHRLTQPYRELETLYGDTELSMEGDFRERLSKLSDHLIEEFFVKVGADAAIGPHGNRINITTNQVTEILHQHDIRELYAALVNYLLEKNEVWLLFDNIDKGWRVEGVSTEDIVILRCLINASRKIEREFRTRQIVCHSVIFVRDDVYTLLMQGSSDYGKEMRASLDWSDGDLLGQVLKLRINRSQENEDYWSGVCVSHYDGEPWLEFFARRALMRPRNLLKLFRYSLAYAINMKHQRIEREDITRGLKTYAQDLVIEVDRELTDVFPAAKKLIYEFSEENPEYAPDDLSILIQVTGLDETSAKRVIAFLIYYGVLGIKRVDEEPIYIYDVNYDIEMIDVRVRKWRDSTKYVVNPALWPALNLKN